jgi:hypothetical protein
MIDLGVVRSNQYVSMMEVDDQEWQERQRQEEISRQHQAELLQEELRAAQEQEQQRQEEAARQHQVELCTAQEHQRQEEVADSIRKKKLPKSSRSNSNGNSKCRITLLSS